MFYALITQTEWNVPKRRYCPVLVGHEVCKYFLDFYSLPRAMLGIFRSFYWLKRTFIDHLPDSVHVSKTLKAQTVCHMLWQGRSYRGCGNVL